MLNHFYFALKRFSREFFFQETNTVIPWGRWNRKNNKELSFYLGNIDNEQSNMNRYCPKETRQIRRKN
jgi:hypothetical protein